LMPARLSPVRVFASASLPYRSTANTKLDLRF
jgi:hypothetical protein